jgi:hypothetical protein
MTDVFSSPHISNNGHYVGHLGQLHGSHVDEKLVPWETGTSEDLIDPDTEGIDFKSEDLTDDTYANAIVFKSEGLNHDPCAERIIFKSEDLIDDTYTDAIVFKVEDPEDSPYAEDIVYKSKVGPPLIKKEEGQDTYVKLEYPSWTLKQEQEPQDSVQNKTGLDGTPLDDMSSHIDVNPVLQVSMFPSPSPVPVAFPGQAVGGVSDHVGISYGSPWPDGPVNFDTSPSPTIGNEINSRDDTAIGVCYPPPPSIDTPVDNAFTQERQPVTPEAASMSPSPDADTKLSPKKAEMPYAQLIYQAMMSATNHIMSLQQIYQWFRVNTEKTSPVDKGWQNSIRHNLSMNKVSASISTPKSSELFIYLREQCVLGLRQSPWAMEQR